MTRAELNSKVSEFLSKGGKITTLKPGPDFHFQPYSVRVESNSTAVDTTATETPTEKQAKELGLEGGDNQ